MAEVNSDLGLAARSWNAAKIYGGSNFVSKFGAVVESDSLQSLAYYVENLKRDRQIETSRIDPDIKDDDRLLKYNIVKITPIRNLEQAESLTEMYLIVDKHGHDIGLYCPDAKNGPKFILSEKIQKGNEKIIEKIIEKFAGNGKEVLQENYSINSFEKLVEKLSKGESIDLHSEEQAKDEIVRNSVQGINSYQIEEQEDPEEKKALNDIPADMRAEVVEVARKRGIQIKEILIVNNPKQLALKLDDNRKNQISEYGGPVILIRAKARKSR